jgi:hypothetical protein
MLHMRDFFLSLLAITLVSGCATPYVSAPLPLAHPANPSAAEAPPPPSSQASRNESVLLPSAKDVPTQESHSGHGAMQSVHGGH